MSQIQQPETPLTERIGLSEWQVQTLRLTGFLDLQAQVDHSTWWEGVLRGAPDREVTERARNTYTATGPFEGGILKLSIQPGRVDWQLQSVPADFPAFPTVGSLPELREVFCELMHRWFGLAEPPVLTRVAFGAILLYPVDRREAGYRLLQQYLDHVELDPVGSTDFMYQINRPRDATTEVVGLRINRLSRWSVASFVPALLHVSSDGIGPVAQQAAQYACGLQLDVNTVPDYRGPLAQDQLRPIFTELVRLGMEIVEMGDVP